MKAIHLSARLALADPLQQVLDAIEGYMFLGLKREAFQEWRRIRVGGWHWDFRLRSPSAALIALEEWSSALIAQSETGRPKAEIIAELGLDLPCQHLPPPENPIAPPASPRPVAPMPWTIHRNPPTGLPL